MHDYFQVDIFTGTEDDDLGDVGPAAKRPLTACATASSAIAENVVI